MCAAGSEEEMLPTYHNGATTTYGVRERIGEQLAQHYCLKFSVSLKFTGICLTLSLLTVLCQVVDSRAGSCYSKSESGGRVRGQVRGCR